MSESEVNNFQGLSVAKLTPEYWAKFRKDQAALFPRAIHGSQLDLRRSLVGEFETALRAGKEEAIQRFITANPYLLQYCVQNTGHHGIWVFPKRMIRMQKVDGTPGLIPDYLAVASNSLGYSWHIFELKRWNTQFVNERGDGFSTVGGKAAFQCASYLTHMNEYVESVRSSIGVQEITPPKSVILLIGDSTTETDAQRTRRYEFSKLAPQLEIASYDRLRRGLANDVHHRPAERRLIER